MQPFSPTAITALLVVIVGFAAVMIFQMLRQSSRQKQPNRRPTPPSRPVQPPAPAAVPLRQTPETQLQPQESPIQEKLLQEQEPRPLGYQTGKPGALLESQVQPAPRIQPAPPWQRLGKSILTVAGFVAMAVLLLIAMPQSWFDGLVRRLPGRHATSVTSGETLWLGALAEEKSAEQLRVTGKIRNVSARELRNPQAVIKVYGFDNNVMGTIAAPLKEYYLAPQAESEFALSYQVDSSKILRYTIAFQEPDGTALPHKDVRSGKP
jgi:hypothetical protein